MYLKDTTILIALNLPYPDVISLCQTDSLFFTICRNDNFWRQKLDRDFPLYTIDTNITYKENYRAAYLAAFREFKTFVGIKELAQTGEITLFRDKLQFTYTKDNGYFQLIGDAYIADKGIWQDKEVSKLYVGRYVYIDTTIVDINSYVINGHAIGVSNINTLDLNNYIYGTVFTSNTPTEILLQKWAMLGFLYVV
jgi:hypothetical protein